MEALCPILKEQWYMDITIHTEEKLMHSNSHTDSSQALTFWLRRQKKKKQLDIKTNHYGRTTFFFYSISSNSQLLT